VVSAYFTQDFGSGTPSVGFPVRMGIHAPEFPQASVEFFADWQASEPPAKLYAVLDGDPLSMALEYGAAEQGIYRTAAELSDADCYEYYFTWETADGDWGTVPEEGSWLFGNYCDSEPMWKQGQWPLVGNDGDLLDDVRLVGCTTASTGSSMLLALAGLLGLRRRRRSG